MSAINDYCNCVKVTPLPANPPRRVCFLPAPGTHHASPGRGERRGLGASLRGLGGGVGVRRSRFPNPVGAQLGQSPKPPSPPPPTFAGGIPEPEGSRGWSCPSALTPEIPEPGGRGVRPRASGNPARSDPTWLVVLRAGFLSLGRQLRARVARTSLSQPLCLVFSPGLGCISPIGPRGSRGWGS